MISQVIIMALFTLQYGVEELEAYVIIFIIFLLWTVISVSKKVTDVDRWNRNRDVFVLRQRREIIFLGFPPKFFVSFYFYLKMYIFLWGAWFPSEKSHVDRWNLHRDVFVLRQRWEIISLGFQNEIICFIRVWKMVYQQLENAHFPLRSLISSKKSHVDRINLHRNVCDETTVRNHLILSERTFLFIRIWKNCLPAIWKCTFEKNVLRKHEMACNLIR